MSRSIYQILCDNIKDGILDPDFSLESPSDPSMFKWAPGALDGVLMYHMASGQMNASKTKALAQALKAAAQKDYTEADRLFVAFCKDNRAVTVVDELQNYIIKHQKQLPPGMIYQAGLNFVLSSENIETVKIGLEMLELFEEPDDDVKEIVRRLGLYDEFALFAVWNMKKWKDGNNEIFELAKKTRSWGRIHAVKRLEPSTGEIRRWLLTEGTRNDVENAYSSLTCWKKSEAEKILFGDIDREEYDGISTLIAGLVDEGPVPGISELENAEKILLQFLFQSGKFDLTWEDYEVIRSVKLWAEDEDKASVVSRSSEILSSPNCVSVITKAVEDGNALNLAAELSVPYADPLYECMKKDFQAHYYSCRYLMELPDYRERTMDLFRNNLPLEEMTGELNPDSEFGDEFRKYNQLQFMLQELGFLPLTGTDFVITGLSSRYAGTRNAAVRCLKYWVEENGRPLEELSAGLFDAVQKALPAEPDEERSDILTRLLKGETHFRKENESEEEQDESGET